VRCVETSVLTVGCTGRNQTSRITGWAGYKLEMGSKYSKLTAPRPRPSPPSPLAPSPLAGECSSQQPSHL
jgi:hypothetical protein